MQELTHLPPQWTESHNSICIFKSCLESVQSEKSKRASAKQQMVIWSCKDRENIATFLMCTTKFMYFSDPAKEL